MTRLQNHYKNIVSYDLITKFNYKNSFEIPNIKNISINLSSISLANEKKKIISLLLAIELITGHTFNQKIDHLPNYLKILKMGFSFNQSIDYLPRNLNILELIKNKIYKAILILAIKSY